jgi:hypothetical protein
MYFKITHSEIDQVLYTMETLAHAATPHLTESERDERLVEEALETLRTVIERGMVEEKEGAEDAKEQDEQSRSEDQVEDSVQEESSEEKADS